MWTHLDRRASLAASLPFTPPRKMDPFLDWLNDHCLKILFVAFLVVLGSFLVNPLYTTFTRPVTAQTAEGGIFISPDLSPESAVATVRDWVPQQEPFLLTPDKIRSVSLNSITNNEPGFIMLKDNTVIPFTIHNQENIVTVAPNNSVSMTGAHNGE